MKAIRFLFAFTVALVATLTYTNVSLGADLDQLRNFLDEQSVGVYVAASPLLTALDAYSGTYENYLFSTLQNEMDIAKDVTFVSGIKDTKRMTKLKVAAGARPYAGGLEDTRVDALRYSNTKLEVRTGQRDILIEIEKYKKTHLEQQRAQGSGANAKEIPFAAFTMEEVFRTLAAEINDETAYHGVDADSIDEFDALEVYTAGDMMWILHSSGLIDYFECLDTTTAGQTPTTHPAKWKQINARAIFPGLKQQVAAGITAGSLVPVTTGAITATDAYDQFTTMHRSHSDPYRTRPGIIYCAPTNFYHLVDSIEENVAKYTEKDSSWGPDGSIILPKSNGMCRVKPATWMSGTNRLLYTPKANIEFGTDKASDMRDIANRDMTNYLVVSSIKFRAGITFRDFEALRVNDQA